MTVHSVWKSLSLSLSLSHTHTHTHTHTRKHSSGTVKLKYILTARFTQIFCSFKANMSVEDNISTVADAFILMELASLIAVLS